MRPDSDIWAIVAIGLGWKEKENIMNAAKRALDEGKSVKAAQTVLTINPNFDPVTKQWGALWRAARIIAMSPDGTAIYWPAYAKRTKYGKLGPPPGTPTIREVYLRRRREAIAEIERKRREARSLILALGADVPS